MAAIGLDSNAISKIASQLSGRDIGDDEEQYDSDVSIGEEEEVDATSDLGMGIKALFDTDLSDDRISRPEQACALPRLVNDDMHHNKQTWRDVYVASISLKQSSSGYRKYVWSKPKTVDSDWIEAQLNNSDNTINANQQTLTGSDRLSNEHVIETKIPHNERDSPLQFPLCAVGYSVRCMDRLAQHASHSSSNYVMNLAEAIFNACRAQFQSRYSIEQHVIYLIWSADQAEIAEIDWSKLAESYTHNAGGFSHYPTGMSNHSASGISRREWSAAKAYMLKNSPFRHSLAFRVSELEKTVLAAEKAEADEWDTEDRRLEAEKLALEEELEAIRQETEMWERKTDELIQKREEEEERELEEAHELMELKGEVNEALPKLEALAREAAHLTTLLKRLKATGDVKIEDMDTDMEG